MAAKGFPVSFGSRSTEVAFDWEDRSTWAAVLEDVGAVFLMYTSGHRDSHPGDTIRAFSDLAVAHGVGRLVLLSARGADQAAAEQAVRDSGAEWTVLQAAWFNQEFDEGVFADAVFAGGLALVGGQVWEPFIDAGDLADIVAAALTEDGHAGRNYELTGRRLLAGDDVAAAIANETNRDVAYVPVTGEQFGAVLTSDFDMRDEEVAVMIDIFATLLDGPDTKMTDGVRQLLSRESVDFADFISEAVASGVWKQD
ncbi:NAD(P)H-binding protein [Nocardia sp. NPDC051463]|uniref:SDR family oxidoreductase n=1 Tax=Nocardia sp. NPDC051463 TaxID=3154845 RepID=UPI00344F8E0D